MAERITRQLIAEKAIIHDTPVLRAAGVDRSFELPTGLYLTMATLFFVAAGILALGFAAPGMAVPTGIIAVFIAMFFAVPAQWVRMNPRNDRRAASWSRFRHAGIVTAYGHCSAGAASVQVLILPVLLVLWGIAVVTIAAMVR